MKLKFPWFYYAGRWLMRFLMLILTSYAVHGRENIPVSGPFLVIANHLNNADPPLVAVSIPRKLFFMAKEELFRHKPWDYFVRGFGAFPVHRGRVDLGAIKYSKHVLDAGHGLVMFPEGMRSTSGCMIPALPGSALIAVNSNVPILPVGITGTEKMWQLSWIFKRPRIVVTIGKPFMLPHNSRVTKQELADLTESIMLHIAELLPEKYQGCYSLARRRLADDALQDQRVSLRK